MSSLQVTVTGTLYPDGTLKLDRKPDLPPGPVEVVIATAAPALPSGAPAGWWDYLQRARAEREASGKAFRTREEIDAEIDAMRAEWDRPRPS